MVKPYFDPLVIDGETFDLSHLQPFTLEFASVQAKKTLRVRVTFSNHCFTRAYEAAIHIPSEPIIDPSGPRPRAFCRIRYRLSLALPALVNGLNQPAVKVWETNSERNWVYSIKIDDPAGPYHLFFEVTRAAGARSDHQDLNLVVESAYHEDPEKGPPILRGRMSFLLLCSKVYLRQPIATKR